MSTAKAAAQAVELCAIFDDRRATANPRTLATVCAIINGLRDQDTKNKIAIGLCEYLHENHAHPFDEAVVLEMCGFDYRAFAIPPRGTNPGLRCSRVICDE